MECISAHQLVHAAESYWCTELLSVGLKLLKLLESFRILAVEKSLPAYYVSQTLVHVFEAAHFLLTQCRFLSQTNDVYPSLVTYIDLSAEEYFLHVFSLHWRNTKALLSKDRSFQSKASRNFLKEAILRRFVVEVVDVEGASPTLAQVIQVAVILLGSSLGTNGGYEEITCKINTDSPWNWLIKDLLTDARLLKSDGTMRLVQNLCDSLIEAYNSISNISPSCFVFLLDRLLVLVSCFNGCLIATRSSVTEWLVHLNWTVSQQASGFNDARSLLSLGHIYDFLAYTIYKLFINKQLTEEWISKAGLDLKKTFPLLILKLLVLMCLICLNAEKHFLLLTGNSANYLGLLNDVLNRPDIISFLPSHFSGVLFQRDSSTLLNVLAEALQKIDDPLVVIRNADVCPPVHARHAVFLNVFNMNADKILEKLFPSQWRNY